MIVSQSLHGAQESARGLGQFLWQVFMPFVQVHLGKLSGQFGGIWGDFFGEALKFVI